jgi:hypothetical protein
MRKRTFTMQRSFNTMALDDDMRPHSLTGKWVSRALLNDKRRGADSSNLAPRAPCRLTPAPGGDAWQACCGTK